MKAAGRPKPGLFDPAEAARWSPGRSWSRFGRIVGWAAVPLAGLGLLSGCAGAPSALDPRGPGAAQVTGLWWILFWLAAVIFVVVEALLVIAIWRGRRNQILGEPRQIQGNTRLEIAWTVAPGVILAILFVLTVRTMAALAAPPGPADLTIQVTGQRWWWEVRYPDQGIITANEIHIPAGRPVQIELTAGDVIHSFWVPQLQGKLDAVPGHMNRTWLLADQPGTYRGQCAEYCGTQHANMAFLVIADPPDQFAAYLAAQRQPAAEPTDPLARRGRELVTGAVCASCHTIQGTSAQGQVAPDLTHFGSRRTLAAGTVENTPENLAAWLTDTEAIKPGNRMGQFTLDPDTIQALTAYLASLK